MWHKSSILVTLLSGSIGEECALQTPESSAIRQPWWKLCLELRRTESALPGRWEVHVLALFVLTSGVGMFQRRYCRVCDAGPCRPPMVCCHASSAAWAAFWIYSFAVTLSSSSRAQVGGGCCFENRGKASFRGSLRQKASCDCILDQCLDARLGCDDGSQVRWRRDVSRSLVTDSGLACVESALRHVVLCEAGKSLSRALSNLVVDFSSSFPLQDHVAVHSEDVVDAADSQTFA